MKNIEFLSKKGALGIREGARIEQLNALRTKLGITGNQVGGVRAITDNQTFAPNFSSTVQTQDINKIHAKEEESQRAQKQTYDKRKQLLEDAEKEQTRLHDLRISQESMWNKEATDMYNKLTKVRSDDDKKLYEEQLKRIESLQDLANNNYKESQKLFEDAEKDKLREFEKTVDGINQTFREGFASLINGGNNSWKSFTKSLFTTFKTTVADQIYRLFAQPFIVKMIASIAGITGASGTAQAATDLISGGGISGGSSGFSLGGLKDIFSNTNASIISGIEGLGASLSNGLAVIFNLTV